MHEIVPKQRCEVTLPGPLQRWWIPFCQGRLPAERLWPSFAASCEAKCAESVEDVHKRARGGPSQIHSAKLVGAVHPNGKSHHTYRHAYFLVLPFFYECSNWFVSVWTFLKREGWLENIPRRGMAWKTAHPSPAESPFSRTVSWFSLRERRRADEFASHPIAEAVESLHVVHRAIRPCVFRAKRQHRTEI